MKLKYGEEELILTSGSAVNETVQTKSIYFSIIGDFPDIQPPKNNELKVLRFIDDNNNIVFERTINRLDCQKTWYPAKSISGTFYYTEEAAV